ncbi:MAG: VWA domain-containing protein [Rikenellaceae bacterium]|nr:VWA domain-containing protein [Rikenellaceae bacterium]
MMSEQPHYCARITRKCPSAFVFLINLSGSMEERVTWNGEAVSKSVAVSELINGTIAELIHHCRREEGYRDYLDIAVIGYGGDRAWSLLPEGHSHPVFRKPDELAYAPVETIRIFKERQLPDGNRAVAATESKCWVKPHVLGKTPMFGALEQVYRLLFDWTRQHGAERCFPPIVINISDGEATDAEPRELLAMAEKIRELRTADGNVLLMNIFIGAESGKPAVLFPANESELPDTPYARLLFAMSSPMPAIYRARIGELTGNPVPESCRGMSYNASMTDLISLLNIGSLSVSFLT